jgi:hypothetical protein
VRDFMRGNITVLPGGNEANAEVSHDWLSEGVLKLVSSENGTGGHLLKHNRRSNCLLTKIVILILSRAFKLPFNYWNLKF